MQSLAPFFPYALFALGTLAAGYAVLVYGLGTWAVHARVTHPHQAVYLFTDPADVPPAVAAEMKPHADALARLGFEAAGWLRSGAIAGSHIAFFVHRGSGDTAAVLHLAAAPLTWVDLQTELATGEQVITTNLPHQGIFAAHPASHIARLPRLRDVRALYEAHRRHVALKAADRGAAVLVPAPGREAEWLAEDETRTWQRQCEVGMHTLEGGAYRLTWRGALRAVVRVAPPTAWLARASMRRRARRLERALQEDRTLPPPRRVVTVGDPVPRVPVPIERSS
ncbi:MAG TPA: hypothetical protein VHG91_04770 [Longimicrobium sp.]|nr:hypothetical protein [Longimicrobium sp.]